MSMLAVNLPSGLQTAGLTVEEYPAAVLPAVYRDQLIDKSRQAHVMRYERHEDADGRFRDPEAYRLWSTGKERMMYLLLNQAMATNQPEDVVDVGGVIWFGERENPHVPGYDVTFAIRLYDKNEQRGWGQYVSRGLAVPFMQAAHDAASQHFPNRPVWLDLAEGNEAAHRTYGNFGYEDLMVAGGRIIMGNTTALQMKHGL